MRILALGPVEIRSGGEEVGLQGAKTKSLLSALLVQLRQVVPTSRLIDLLWDDAPPRSAAALVHTYVSQLRRALSEAGMPSALITRAPGYLLDIGHADSDVTSFQLHVDNARQAERQGDHDTAITHYERAIALWRGPAFGGADASFVRQRAAWLEAERLGGEEGLARCMLRRGQTEEALSRLGRLTGEHPLREEAHGLLMRALYVAGRQADALAVYRGVRQRLVDEQGVEPGAKLRELHGAILEGAVESDARPASVPSHLPPDIPDFTGHERQLADVLRLGRRTVVISGFGGAGKSALAVHAAHRLRAEYPDGQLFADLRGTCRDASPHEVLGRFLGALGVSAAAMPNAVDDRVDLYRRMVSGRRLLIVLDNARDERQVRALLPGEPNCMVIITSRSRLTGLDGIDLVELDVFPLETAILMLGRVIGARRVAEDHRAAATVAELCGGVPLAIRTAAAKLLARPHWPLRAFASRLTDERRRLDELAAGDLVVRSSLWLNYAELDGTHRRAFHLLALLNLPDFGWWVAAELLEIPLEDAEDAVERLVELRLLDVLGIDALGRVRYRFHDLVRLFGAERARAEESAETITEAVGRTLAAWTALVQAGARRMPRITLGLCPPIPVRVDLDPRLLAEVEERPLDWFRSETAAVVRAVECAHDLGIDGTTTMLFTSLLSSPFAVRNEFDGWQRTHDAALATARDCGDHGAEAVVLAGLGQLHYERDDFSAAMSHFRRAGELASAAGDGRTLAVALAGTGTVWQDLAEFDDARQDLLRAAELADRHGMPWVVAATDYQLAAISRDRGDVAEAITHLRRCVRLYRALNDHRGTGMALRGLSLCHRALGDADAAVELSEQARTVLLAAGDELGASYATQALAKARIRQGQASGVAALLDSCREVCVRQGDRFGSALVARTSGELALATGDGELASALLRGSLARWTELGLPLWRARTLRDLAAAIAADHPDEATAHWDEALALFQASRAREAAELADQTPMSWLAAARDLT
ncbi:tetratricopeptide repeat protein [Allokutzneria sp. A3M-2-11 16]|uniref:AfsR/SARP family transcriptional regulator n=1 Tax=Allokutzneria sp. A3M-2-11 16 TaxID=2962043 RepID=UPI0020B650EE|nr:BTAD domain-containing putative transcriptional regulator [Allokutzneria sp. A3M-2-11 16]MCP3803053.1 tetratricopeptide repeat protein [Allokutzneria sp. A3M-2-11 16]